MSAVQLYAKKQGSTQYVALDLNNAEPIKLNLSVANIIDPTATNSTFSKTFKVPHTSINGPYFKGVFNVNSMNFNAATKADAYILDNGIFFENGYIILNAIYTNSEDNSVEYEITFYGATSDFGAKIGGGFLNEVNLNAYNHTKNYTNITNSWTGQLFNYDVVYGLIEWGYTYDNNNRPNIPTLSAGFERSFTNPATISGYIKSPYKLQQWKPQIRAKALWDQIFEEAGYTYDSTFLDSDFFKKQYIISDNEARAILDNANTFKAENQGVYYNVLAAQFPWITPVEIEDPGSNFVPSQTTSGIYTAPSTGNYSFKMATPAVDCYVTGSGNTVLIGWEAKVINVDTNQVMGLDVGQWTFSTFAGNTETLDAQMNTYLTANTKVKFEFRTFLISGTAYSGSTELQFFDMSVECTSAPDIMSFNAIMPSNIRKIDFMKSIINRYRLVFVPSKFQANHFTITPWKDWILEGQSKDWTDKLDTSKDMVIKPLFFDQARFQIYKDQEDSDYLNYNYQLGIKQTFGQLNLDSTNELIKGTKEYKDQFAPTPLDGIGYISGNAGTEDAAASFLIPHMAKDTGGNGDVVGAVSVGKREPIQPKLRLVFYNGLKTAPINWYMAQAPADTTGTVRTTYPMMSQYSEWPVTSTTYDLNWENELPLYDTTLVQTYGVSNPKAQTTFSCFNTFWKTWYDVTFDPYSRIVEANFVLDYNDILDLKFNDYIFVKDAWYFVNSVSNYVTGTRSNCRVQLVKLGNNVGITLPVVSPPTYASFATCYHPSTLCVAACCETYNGSQSVTIYGNGATLITSTVAYQDAFGGIIAAPGYYKDASGTVYVNGNGTITVQDTSGCNCTPVYYSFTAYLNSTGCEVCCNNGPTVVLYGSNPVFEANAAFYSNTGLTLPAPAGFYMQAGSTFALQVLPNGSVANAYLCSTCQCTTYYPFTVCKSTSLCTACCCPRGSMTVYGTDPTFSNNISLYLDNAGATPAPAAWYKYNSTTVAQVTGIAGDITAFGTCSGCAPCPVGPVSGTVNVAAGKAGYTTSTIIQKSYDNGETWVDVVTLSIDPSDPENTEKTVDFTCEENVKLRAINSSTTVSGTMTTNYALGADTFDDKEIDTPATSTTTIPSNVSSEYVYVFNNTVTGGEINVEDNLLVSGSFVSYQGDTDYKGAIALTATAAVDTNIDFTTGFTNSGDLATCYSIIQIGDIIVVSGIFNTYKGVFCNTNVVGLNLDGTINDTFTNNLPTTASVTGYRLTYIDETKFAISAVGNTTDIDLAIIDNAGDLIIAVGDGYGATGFNAPITALRYYSDALYVTGNFSLYKSPTSGSFVSTTRLTKLTLDLELASGFDGGTGPSNQPVTIDVTSNGIYVAANAPTPSYNGTSVPGKIYKVNLDGSLDTTFLANIGTGLSDNINRIADGISADEDGIWLVGEMSAWNGVSGRYNIIRLNLDGTYNSDFDNSTQFDPSPIFGTNLMSCKLYDDNLYVYGDFDTYKGNQEDGLIKLDKFTGAVDTTFAVGTGFATNPGSTNKVLDIFRYQTPIPPTLYLLNTSYSEAPCVAFCDTAYATPIYANATPLINATILYTDALGTTPAPAGYYAVGSTIAEVDSNGVIIGFYNPESCVCNNLYQFDVDFDIEQCISCGTTGTPSLETVYGTQSTWSTNTILYSDAAGTTYALPGFYTYAGSIVLEVGDNGFVIDAFDCFEVCPPGFTDCRGVSVINESLTDIWVYYQECEGCGTAGLYKNLYLPYGQETDLGGALIVYGSVSTSGPSKIIWGAIC